MSSSEEFKVGQSVVVELCKRCLLPATDGVAKDGELIYCANCFLELLDLVNKANPKELDSVDPDYRWISFVVKKKFAGVVIVKADSNKAALEEATRLGLNLGGEALVLPVSKSDLEKFGTNRIVNARELKKAGTKRLRQLSKEELEIVDRNAVALGAEVMQVDIDA